MGPAGGASNERGVVPLSGFSWESIRLLGRPVLGQAFEAQKIILIAARYCVAREKSIHRLAKHARQCVVAAHPHSRLRRGVRRTVLTGPSPPRPALSPHSDFRS